MNDRPLPPDILEQIEQVVAALLPAGAGGVRAAELRAHLEKLAQSAYLSGQRQTLTRLLTVQDVANEFGITPGRMRTIARRAHDQHGVGFQVPGTNNWLFLPEELDALRPQPRGYPKGRPRQSHSDTPQS